MKGNPAIFVLVSLGLAGCASTRPQGNGTLAELEQLPSDTTEVYLDDSLDLAAQSYRRYLEETPETAQTPEAMRRLADLQLEREYGIIGGGQVVEMATPEPAEFAERPAPTADSAARREPAESDQDFERRATAREELLSSHTEFDVLPPGDMQQNAPSGPREAIEIYRTILEKYPNYERNDQVLYQMSRAYDEIGETEVAMEVMEQLVAGYPYSKYLDEVHFRRGEYYFVRRSFLDAEEEYASIVGTGSTSSYYELALYKLGWALYKQDMYDEALDRYIAMLDYRLSIGYDFDQTYEEDDEHRVADTFRVISLSFSNLGGAEVVNEYFAANGHRSYADKIYSNLGEFYFGKLRYEDAASIYRSFVDLNSFHRVAPNFSMRIIEIYDEAAFPQLVVEAKKEFAADYALDSEYWNYVDVSESAEVLGFLKTNLTDLANHYHALYQLDELVEERPATFVEAQRYYRQFLSSFPNDADSPPVNYQLADLLLENENYVEAAREYERTAYEYPVHEQSAAAGYAAIYAYREELKVATGAAQLEVKQATVKSSLVFVDAFQEHEQAPVVLGAAVDDLYEMKDFPLAIASARKLIDRYPSADPSLRRAAWAVIANSSIDIAAYPDAEHAYLRVLELTPAEDESRAAIIDGLAASIYKQGEQALLLKDYRAAADHFLRIRDVAPTSGIRTAAEYDAAAALVKLQDWDMAAGVLEEFRAEFPEHELHSEATKQLAHIYREDGQIERSAAEHERIADESSDPELGREALLTAGELYDQIDSVDSTIRVYERYVREYPRPLDLALETRSRLAEIFKSEHDLDRYHEELSEIVAIDESAGADRTDRSRYLAAIAALVLAERSYHAFAELKLVQPFEESLAEMQRRMDETMAALERLVAYEVAEVTAAATYYIAETYIEFSNALLTSERPTGLTDAELNDYELVIEEEAYPFEERALEVHEQNFELVTVGVYNAWVQKSLDKLTVLMPGRYAKNEISGGFVGSIDTYAYRKPNAPDIGIDGQDNAEAQGAAESAAALGTTAQVVQQPGQEP